MQASIHLVIDLTGILLVFTLQCVALRRYLYAFASTRMSMVLEPIIAQSFILSEMLPFTMQQLMVQCLTVHQVMCYYKAVRV